LFVIFGASKGLGAEIGLKIAQNVGDLHKISVHLYGVTDCTQTGEQMGHILKNRGVEFSVEIHHCDLSEQPPKLNFTRSDYSNCFFVFNFGSISPIAPLQLWEAEDFTKHIALNVTNFGLLLSSVTKLLYESPVELEEKGRIVFVNISSLAAHCAQKSREGCWVC